MLRTRYLAGILLCALFLVACEDVFTNNLLSGFQRDPDNLSKEQLLNRATFVGDDKSEAAKIYDALKDKVKSGDGANVNIVMVDLALTASGVLDELQDLVQLGIDGNLGEAEALGGALDASLDKVDYTYILEAQQQIQSARAKGGTVTTDQYVFVTVGLIMMAASEQETSVSEAQPDAALTQFVDDAVADLESQGKTGTALRELKDYLDGLSNS